MKKQKTTSKKQQAQPNPIQKHLFYIDRLCQVWFRYRFQVYSASKEEAFEKAKDIFENNDEDLIGPNFQEECLYNTMVIFPPQSPNYETTKEMFYAWDLDPIASNGIDSIDLNDLLTDLNPK